MNKEQKAIRHLEEMPLDELQAKLQVPEGLYIAGRERSDRNSMSGVDLGLSQSQRRFRQRAKAVLERREAALEMEKQKQFQAEHNTRHEKQLAQIGQDNDPYSRKPRSVFDYFKQPSTPDISIAKDQHEQADTEYADGYEKGKQDKNTGSYHVCDSRDPYTKRIIHKINGVPVTYDCRRGYDDGFYGFPARPSARRLIESRVR